jgi:hypothetical protein
MWIQLNYPKSIPTTRQRSLCIASAWSSPNGAEGWGHEVVYLDRVVLVGARGCPALLLDISRLTPSGSRPRV